MIITRRGYYRVIRPDGTFLSRHTSRDECYEAITEDGTGLYTIECPNREVRVAEPIPEPEPIPDPTGPTYSGNELFLDKFNYPVNRLSANDAVDGLDQFVSQGGWEFANAIQTRNRGLDLSGYSLADIPNASQGGFLYTVDSIPGYSGRIPGEGRALCIEAPLEDLRNSGNSSITPMYAGTSNEWHQTNIYLSLGATPANIWHQYWIFINNDETQYSRIRNTKWLYHYQSEYNYLSLLGTWSMECDGEQYHIDDDAGAYIATRSCRGAVWDGAADPGNPDRLGPNLIQQPGGYVPFGQWVLVKTHYDLSGSQGEYHQWFKIDGVWVKNTEWIGGVTDGFTWPLDDAHRVGHQSLRFPTTFNYYPLSTEGEGRRGGNAWIYLVDYCLANNEADLPVY